MLQHKFERMFGLMDDKPQTKEEKSELPDVKDVKKVQTPTDPQIKEAFENAAINAVQAVIAAEQAVKSSDDVPAAEEDLAKAKLRLEIIAKAQGTTTKELQGKTVSALTNAITQAESNISEWERIVKIHQAFLDTPEAFGYVDFAGFPIIPKEQRTHIANYNAAIVTGQVQVTNMKSQRDALLSSPEEKPEEG